MHLKWSQNIWKKTGGIANQGKNREHLDYSIVEIGQKAEKSLGDLKRLAVNHTPEKDHQRMKYQKTRKKTKKDKSQKQEIP